MWLSVPAAGRDLFGKLFTFSVLLIPAVRLIGNGALDQFFLERGVQIVFTECRAM